MSNCYCKSLFGLSQDHPAICREHRCANWRKYTDLEKTVTAENKQTNSTTKEEREDNLYEQ